MSKNQSVSCLMGKLNALFRLFSLVAPQSCRTDLKTGSLVPLSLDPALFSLAPVFSDSFVSIIYVCRYTCVYTYMDRNMYMCMHMC